MAKKLDPRTNTQDITVRQINHRHGVKTQIRLVQPLRPHVLWGFGPAISLPG